MVVGLLFIGILDIFVGQTVAIGDCDYITKYDVNKNATENSYLSALASEAGAPKSPKKYAVVIFVRKSDFAALCSGTTFKIRVW